jgi:predicted RNase H-like HicB family nuclease
MFGKSKSSFKTINRPIDRGIRNRAAEMAAKYQIILEFSDGEYIGRGLEMPYVMGDGKTPDECVTSTREALTVAVACLLEEKKTASMNKRTEQINVRLTPEEKLLLEELARTKGFSGVSDFVRSTSLSSRD